MSDDGGVSHDARPAGYIPAAGHDRFLALYDPALRWLMREDVFKQRLVREANIRPGQRVLDLGCGTATLTILIARLHPDADVIGIDGDPKVLALANRKVTAAGSRVRLDQGLATELPYPDESFDRVVSSLVLHHLTRDDKSRTLAEVHRVLRANGSCHIVDFGPPSSRIGQLLSHLVHRGERLRDNVDGRLPALLDSAGFRNVEHRGQHTTPFGALAFYSGRK